MSKKTVEKTLNDVNRHRIANHLAKLSIRTSLLEETGRNALKTQHFFNGGSPIFVGDPVAPVSTSRHTRDKNGVPRRMAI